MHLETYTDYLNWMKDNSEEEDDFTISAELVKTLVENKLVDKTDLLHLRYRIR